MARGNDNRRFGARLAAALGAALVLGLAAVAMNAARGTALAGEGPAKSRWVLLALLVVILAVPLALRVRRSHEMSRDETPTQSRISAMVVPGFAVMAAATFIGLAILGTRGIALPPPPDQGISAPQGGDDPTGRGTATAQSVPSTSSNGISSPIDFKNLLLGFLILLAVAGAVLLITLLVRWLIARRRAGEEIDGTVAGELEGDGTGEALADAVQAGREALADDRDPRTAIIACYAAMEASLAEGGISRRKADTPADLLQRAVEAGLVQGIAAQTLTDLFSEARYSTHPMGEHQRDQARAALESISAHLAAATADADARFGEREEIQI